MSFTFFVNFLHNRFALLNSHLLHVAFGCFVS